MLRGDGGTHERTQGGDNVGLAPLCGPGGASARWLGHSLRV